MGKVIVGTTMSLDGFMNDQQGSVALLYADMDAVQESAELRESIENTGAAVMGRNTYEMGGGPDAWADGYEFQVPIFVLTHEPPAIRPKQAGNLSFTFVTAGIESVIRQAVAAAGDKDVTVVGGADTMQQVLRAGLADELHLDIMPVLLGGGLRPFGEAGVEGMQLEQIRATVSAEGRVQLRYRVVR